MRDLHRLRDRTGEHVGRGVGGDDRGDAQPVQPVLALVVAGRDHPDHGDAAGEQAADGVTVEPPQVCREQNGAGLTGLRGREQVG